MVQLATTVVGANEPIFVLDRCFWNVITIWILGWLNEKEGLWNLLQNIKLQVVSRYFWQQWRVKKELKSQSALEFFAV